MDGTPLAQCTAQHAQSRLGWSAEPADRLLHKQGEKQNKIKKNKKNTAVLGLTRVGRKTGKG
jgi:hypothetical protein